jgi:hypothetical protein
MLRFKVVAESKRESFRAFFHWQYSQFFIGTLFAAGVAATLTTGHFAAAYVFSLSAGVWASI